MILVKKCEENCEFFCENTIIIGCTIFAKLPTPLVRFCLTPPHPPKNPTSLMDVPLAKKYLTIKKFYCIALPWLAKSVQCCNLSLQNVNIYKSIICHFR